jgi:hypothetical protein
MKNYLVGLVVFGMVGCGSSSMMQQPQVDAGPSYPPGFNPPAPPPGGAQFIGKQFSVPAGTEVFKCVYFDVSEELAADLQIKSLQTYQMPGGHHIIFSTVVDSYHPTDDVHDCTDEEMVYTRFIGAGGANPGLAIVLPQGIALQVPAHKRFMIQSHYVNATDSDITVLDAVNLIPAEQPVTQIASMAASSDDTFTLPPMAYTTRDMACTVPADVSVYEMIGHTHEWGKKFNYTLERAADHSTQVLYDNGMVDPSFRSNANIISYPVDMPLQLKMGDILHLHCEWMNDTTSAITFPKEMCVAAWYYTPSNGFEVCDQDGGTFVSQNIGGKPAHLIKSW